MAPASPRLRSECQAVRVPSSDRRAIAVAIGARPTLRAAEGRTGRHKMKITEDRDRARITHQFEEMTPRSDCLAIAGRTLVSRRRPAGRKVSLRRGPPFLDRANGRRLGFRSRRGDRKCPQVRLWAQVWGSVGGTDRGLTI